MEGYLKKFSLETPFTVRNKGPEPFLNGNEIQNPQEMFLQDWKKDLEAHDRLYKHATLSSARRRAHVSCPSAPKDQLDFILEAIYNPLGNTFPQKGDHVLHIETVKSEENVAAEPQFKTWRILRNRSVVVPPKKPPRGHPIVYGGTTQNESIFHVKLGIASNHSPQTNPGYSRTPTGSFYSI